MSEKLTKITAARRAYLDSPQFSDNLTRAMAEAAAAAILRHTKKGFPAHGQRTPNSPITEYTPAKKT